MTANVLPFHDRFNANQLFVAGCQRLNAAGSETVHAVAEMLGFGFAEVTNSIDKIVEGIHVIRVISGQLIGVVFRYMNETNCLLYWQPQCTCPCFNQKIKEILPADFELAELKESIPVQ